MNAEPTTQASIDATDRYRRRIHSIRPDQVPVCQCSTCRAEARNATGLRDRFERAARDAHNLAVLAKHPVHEPACRGTFESCISRYCEILRAALSAAPFATTPPEPRWPSNAVHESANDGFGPDPLGAPPEPLR